MYFINPEMIRRKEMYTLEPIPEPFLYILGHKKIVKMEVKDTNRYRTYSQDYHNIHKDDIGYREKANKKARDIYHLLTRDEKTIVNKKKQEYIKNKIREKLSNPITAEILRQKWRYERKRRNDRIKNEQKGIKNFI